MNKGVQLNALDPNSLGDLKRLARSEGGSDAALRAAARQFEGLFLQMVMKSMRATTGQNGMMDSEQTRSWQGMLDQQMALEMSQSGGTGLSEMLYRQLGGKAAVRPDAAGEAGKTGFDLADVRRRPAIPAVLARDAESAAAPRLAALPAEARVPALGAAATAGEFSALSVYERAALQTRLDAAVRSARDAGGEVSKSAQDFVTEVWPHAQEASRRTGIPAEFMVAQAALETGWDRSSCVTRTAARATTSSTSRPAVRGRGVPSRARSPNTPTAKPTPRLRTSVPTARMPSPSATMPS